MTGATPLSRRLVRLDRLSLFRPHFRAVGRGLLPSEMIPAGRLGGSRGLASRTPTGLIKQEAVALSFDLTTSAVAVRASPSEQLTSESICPRPLGRGFHVSDACHPCRSAPCPRSERRRSRSSRSRATCGRPRLQPLPGCAADPLTEVAADPCSHPCNGGVGIRREAMIVVEA